VFEIEQSQQDKIDDLEHQLYHKERMKDEREISDARYAVKLVEKIVFGMVTLILITVVGAIVALVVR
jgi:lipopolysaccharide/colanic/teichoic acid biosynthesis glycosyltransferase